MFAAQWHSCFQKPESDPFQWIDLVAPANIIMRVCKLVNWSTHEQSGQVSFLTKRISQAKFVDRALFFAGITLFSLRHDRVKALIIVPSNKLAQCAKCLAKYTKQNYLLSFCSLAPRELHAIAISAHLPSVLRNLDIMQVE